MMYFLKVLKNIKDNHFHAVECCCIKVDKSRKLALFNRFLSRVIIPEPVSYPLQQASVFCIFVSLAIYYATLQPGYLTIRQWQQSSIR